MQQKSHVTEDGRGGYVARNIGVKPYFISKTYGGLVRWCKARYRGPFAFEEVFARDPKSATIVRWEPSDRLDAWGRPTYDRIVVGHKWILRREKGGEPVDIDRLWADIRRTPGNGCARGRGRELSFPKERNRQVLLERVAERELREHGIKVRAKTRTGKAMTYPYDHDGKTVRDGKCWKTARKTRRQYRLPKADRL